MITARIDVDLRRAPNAARMIAQADDVIGAKLTEMGLVVERTVKQETPLGATKILRGSIFSEPRGNPVREVLVASTQLYAPFVERGRKPGKFPPRGPIELWVKRKLGATSEKEMKTIAFLIARSIARKGTRALTNKDVGHMFAKGLKAAQGVLQKLAQEIGAGIAIKWDENA